MIAWIKLLLSLFNNTVAYFHTRQLINKGRDEAFLAIEEETNRILHIQRTNTINHVDDAIKQLSNSHPKNNTDLPSAPTPNTK